LHHLFYNFVQLYLEKLIKLKSAIKVKNIRKYSNKYIYRAKNNYIFFFILKNRIL